MDSLFARARPSDGDLREREREMCKFTPACHCPGTSGCVWAGKGACLSRASSKALKQEKEASEGGSDNSGSSDTKVLAYGASSVPKESGEEPPQLNSLGGLGGQERPQQE